MIKELKDLETLHQDLLATKNYVAANRVSWAIEEIIRLKKQVERLKPKFTEIRENSNE